VCRAWPGTELSVGTKQYGGAGHAPAPCVRHDRFGSPGQPGGPVGGHGPARARICRTDAANHDAGNLACSASACSSCCAGGGAFATACCSSSDAGAGANAPKPGTRTMPDTTPGFSHHSSPHGEAPARQPSLPVDYLDKLPRNSGALSCRNLGGQLYLSPGGQFRMSLDTSRVVGTQTGPSIRRWPRSGSGATSLL